MDKDYETINKLNEQELYCLSWHYNIFYEQAKHKKIADYTLPCTTCKYNEHCYIKTKKPVVYKMEQKLPVQITKYKHKKDIFSYGEN